MKITICGSSTFIDRIAELAKELEKLGHEVKHAPVVAKGFDGRQVHTAQYHELKKTMPINNKAFWEDHTHRIQDHFDKVQWCDAILVANYDKNKIIGYIGPNTLMEMGLAFYLKKKVFLLNPVPDIAWKEEILGLRPLVINEKLDLLV